VSIAPILLGGKWRLWGPFSRDGWGVQIGRDWAAIIGYLQGLRGGQREGGPLKAADFWWIDSTINEHASVLDSMVGSLYDEEEDW
jgi:hypothetical protein